MSDQTTDRLSRDQVMALKFAAHRQLARWSDKPVLNPRQRARRSALKGAVRILQDSAFAGGCVLHAPEEDEKVDA
jgi:hypothetical protein